MLIKKEQSDKKENSKSCTVWEYEYPNKNLGMATSKINGRYPEKGKAINKECDMMYFVISGKGIVHTDKGDFEISEGDCYLFEKGNSYWIEGEDLFVVLPTAPTWYFEQYEELN